MTYDPEKQQTENDPEVVRRHFQGKNSGAEAAKLMRLNPMKYQSYKRDAFIMGIIAADPVWKDSNYRDRFEPKTYSAEELRCRNLHSEAETREFFASSDGRANSPGKLAETDPLAYEDWRLAAQSYGLVVARPPKPVEVAPKKSEDRFSLTEDYCQKFNLPAGSTVTQAEYLSMAQIIFERTAREEAEQVAESKQALSQAALDAANEQEKLVEYSGKLDKLVEHLPPAA